MADERKHYSYEVYAREETARSFESQRFGGPIGSYLRERQQQHLARWLGDLAGKTVLDVGAGTGRAAIPLAAAGARVVAADASEAMLTEARRRAKVAGAELTFKRCDAMALNDAARPAVSAPDGSSGDNPVFIEGRQCWRYYALGGWVTMLDVDNCRDLYDFCKRNDLHLEP